MERLHKDHRGSAGRAAAALAGDHLVVLPTDTLCGISARLGNKPGYERVLRLKGRAGSGKFLYLAAGLDMVEHHIASWGCSSKEEMHSRWPAPLTAVFEAARCPVWVGETIAFRVPDDAWLRDVIARVGEPLLSTSVNARGDAPVRDADEIARRFGNDVMLAVVGECGGGKPSTLVDFTGEAPLVIRMGAYDWPAGTNPSK
ncbi:MAG: L-threonylcarbamoyladenylate synthase [Candidatus Krumholzibacteriia bacterium]